MALALTDEVVRKLFPHALDGYIAALVNGARIFDQYGINTPLRLTHFLAQGAAETGGFAITEENGDYSAERLLAVFPHYFSRAQAIAYAKKPKMILSRTYANRLGNGSEVSGDGWTYRGRGMCQLTGRENYAARAGVSGFDLVKEPEKAADPALSLKIFCAEWSDLKLNDWADKGATHEAVLACARGINCGSPTSNIQPNGIKDRQAWFDTIWKTLGDGTAAAVSPVADGILEEGEEGPEVLALQKQLAALGYQIGQVDGIFGERAKAAVLLYQQREGLAGDPGKWIVATYDPTLATAKPLDNPRADTTLTGLKNAGDPQAQQLSLGKRVATLLGVGSGASGAITQADPSQLPQALSDARNVIQPIHEHMQWAAQHWYLAAGMGAALLYFLFHRAAEQRVNDVSQGKATP